MPKSFRIELPWLPDVRVKAGPAAELKGRIAIQENAIPLLMQSLIRFADVQIDGPWDLDFFPDRLSVGDYGLLHFITGTTPAWFEELSSPGWTRAKLCQWFGIPMPEAMTRPLGTEDPAQSPYCCESRPQTYHDFSQCCVALGRPESTPFHECFQEDHPLPYCLPWEFAGENNPKIDFSLNQWIPGQWLGHNARLPDAIPLPELVERLGSREKAGTRASDWKQWLSHLVLENGAPQESLLDLFAEGELHLKLEELADFWIPGFLNLGPSFGELKLRLNVDRSIQGSFEPFSIKLEPMAWGEVRLLGGELVPGKEIRRQDEMEFQPGLHGAWDPVKQVLFVQANLELELALNLPWVGEVQIATPLLFASEWKTTDRGAHPIPGTTRLSLSEIHIRAPESPLPMLPRLSFSLDDRSEEVHFELRGNLGDAGNTDFSAVGAVPLTVLRGRYAWADLAEDLELAAAISLKREKGPRYTGEFYLNTFRPAPFVRDANPPDRGLELRVDLFREENPILEGGEIRFQRIESRGAGGERKWLYLLAAEISSLNWDELRLRDVELRADWERVPEGTNLVRFLIPRFLLRARGASTGVIQGPIQALLAGGDRPLQVSWNRSRGEIQFEDLNLHLNAQGIALPRVLRLRQRKELARIRREGGKRFRYTAGFGVDGRIAGHARLRLSDWSGEGDLRLLGDKKGDVYFLDRKNRPILPPLISRTHWRFRRFDRFLWNEGSLLGVFRLSTRIDTATLRGFGYQIPLQTDVVMSHRDVMLKPGGIDAANRVYYHKLWDQMQRRLGIEAEEQP